MVDQSNQVSSRPLPTPIPRSQPFWDGLRERKVRIQYSPSSDQWVFYPRSLAPLTLADDLEWRDISGVGTLYTYTIARRPTAPDFAGEEPQIIAVIELDEGPRLTSTLVNVDEDQIVVGMRVKPVFEVLPGTETTLLRYEPTT
ncbi:MAG: OB-fold domain-containing protein [Chloroflexi bacterium]|nr:OB-fold domain-containing protein [Chloroflexota bacterium]MCY3696260.1 OB-fold domain-containing protein [Chloroflexota bacterium]